MLLIKLKKINKKAITMNMEKYSKINYIIGHKNKIRIINKIKTILNQLIDLKDFKFKLFFKNFTIININIKKFFISILKVINIIKIKITNSNYFINLTDCNGNTFFLKNSGLIGNYESKKFNKLSIMTILSTINRLLIKLINKENNISIHFLGKKNFLNKNIIKKIKHYLKISEIKFFLITPHNGCRPKKIKRLKKFKLNF